MLSKKKQTYYTISTRYNQQTKNITTILAETDGIEEFSFIASYDKILDPAIVSLIKKVHNYSFSTNEISDLINLYSKEVSQSIKSILAENNIPQADIDFICLENLNLSSDFKADIATPIFKKFNIPVIYDLDISEKNEFLKLLANVKNFNEGIIINLEQDFSIYKLNSHAHLVAQSIGYSVLHYLSIYLNIEDDQLSYYIAQGEADEAIINKVSKIENLENLQKELINLIVFSQISPEDKLKTAFTVIKSLLLKSLSEFDINSKIMLIGNTALVEELNQALKEIYEEVDFLKDQSQRQETLINEQMAYFGAKKYVLENYNNGVKIS